MRLLALLVAAACLAGCERIARNMYEQPRYNPMRESRLFADGSSARAPLPGTVPASEGVIAGTSSGRSGADEALKARKLEGAQANPLPVTLALMQRGRERFEIYCAPCHSPLGDGDGRVARRGFPHPPTYHQPRLREAPDRHFYDVITNGYGVMRPYADRIAPEERWAIVAYIRALQLSQHPVAAR
ncbi:MAG TPA: cytochrome c [Burkholderiales bacterium]|nr:cytochrome c [Burkholderiales bacterium]